MQILSPRELYITQKSNWRLASTKVDACLAASKVKAEEIREITESENEIYKKALFLFEILKRKIENFFEVNPDEHRDDATLTKELKKRAGPLSSVLVDFITEFLPIELLKAIDTASSSLKAIVDSWIEEPATEGEQNSIGSGVYKKLTDSNVY